MASGEPHGWASTASQPEIRQTYVVTRNAVAIQIFFSLLQEESIIHLLCKLWIHVGVQWRGGGGGGGVDRSGKQLRIWNEMVDRTPWKR